MTERLAIDGGSPVRTTPAPGWPCMGDEEIAAAEKVLRSNRINYWTGTECRDFEAEYAEAIGRTYAISLANGTLALELALRAFEIGPGDEVIVPSRTFFATAACAVAVGARPVVADIDPVSGNITAETVEAVLSERTRAIIPVHVGGWPVDMPPIVDLAHERGLVVIEDCAQAHGAALDGVPVGNLGSDAAAFSFCQDKIVPLGEGGMVFFDDEAAYRRAWAYKDHGKSLEKVLESAADTSSHSFRWLIDSFGSNWRMPEIVGAIGREELRKLPAWHVARTSNALRLVEGLADVPGLRIPSPPAGVEHGYYRLHGFVEPSELHEGWDRDRVLQAISAEGVACQYGSCAEIYREKAFVDAGFAPAHRLPVASRFHETCIGFYVHPTLQPSDIDLTIAAVRKVMSVATK